MPTRQLSLLTALCLTAAAAQTDLTLFRDGRSDYVIVKPADASPSQAYAAEELQSLIQQMGGGTLTIATDKAPLPAKAILLGNTKYTAQVLGAKPDLESLGTDGFRLCTKPPHVVILGSGVRGTLYGVYELLEHYGGCRWYASYDSVVPKLKAWTIPAIDDTQIPAFVMREPFWYDMFQGDFAARSRANGNRMDLDEQHGGHIRFGGGLFVHTFFRLMPPSEFFGDHPEYYSEIDGKRSADHTQLCLTNPDVVRIMTARVLEKIRQDPEGKLFSVSQNDWRGYCTCDKCKAIDEREGSPSGTLIHFVNQVAEAVEKEFPDAWIETLAYQYTRHAPKTLRPRDNVVPRLCSIECDFSVPFGDSPYEQNQSFVKDMNDWAAISDKLYVWDYTTNFGHYLGPHPNFAALQGNVQFFRDHGVVGLFEQGAYQAPHAEFAELRAWLLAKLLWNPDQEVEQLYADFFAGFYGPAAKLVRTYFDELQALVQPQEQILRIWSPMTSPWYTDEFFSRAQQLWDQAEQLVAGQAPYEFNVRMGAIPVYYARLERWPKQNVQYVWQDGKVQPTGVDPEYQRLAAELRARVTEGKARFSESADRDASEKSMLQGRTEGYQPLTLQAGAWSAAVTPELGGRICVLEGSDQHNYLSPDAGGIDFEPDARNKLAGVCGDPYSVGKTETANLQLRRDVRHVCAIDQQTKLGDEGLEVSYQVTSVRETPWETQPVIRIACDLGDATALAARAGGEWQPIVMPADQVQLSAAVLVPEGTKTIELASTRTGRGVTIALPDVPLQRAFVLADAERGSARLFLKTAPTELPPHGKWSATVKVTPQPKVDGLPEAPPEVKHTAGNVPLEDYLMSIGRYGTWGESVVDPDAGDGSALKLFNTHFEWCLQWRVDPNWFQAGSTYTVRARLKVAKTGQAGEAFWAGVYDTVRKKGYGQVSPRTDAVEDGYQWYDLATWQPEEGQYVWVGPGRFDKEQGKNTAHDGVYIDRFELVKVE